MSKTFSSHLIKFEMKSSSFILFLQNVDEDILESLVMIVQHLMDRNYLKVSVCICIFIT